MEHPNIDLIHRFFEAYGNHDFATLSLVLDENAKWIFPGRNPLSGIKTGAGEIVAFFDRMGEVMGKSKMEMESLVTGINDSFVVECQHVWINREDGVTLDHHWCVLWRFADGKIVEGKHFAENQYAADIFFQKLIG